MARMTALRVRRGDLVSVRGRWQEVKAVRNDRIASGGPVVMIVFKTGQPLRVHPAQALDVVR
ncbi:hypothetical protein [Streptomyces sp. YGL11-2]|uniref:hypothetical protein n=1 Tax=Streptomyces sp. YGL11-2 TaxID=3414028 RepID=UPI003CF49D60